MNNTKITIAVLIIVNLHYQWSVSATPNRLGDTSGFIPTAIRPPSNSIRCPRERCQPNCQFKILKMRAGHTIAVFLGISLQQSRTRPINPSLKRFKRLRTLFKQLLYRCVVGCFLLNPPNYLLHIFGPVLLFERFCKVNTRVNKGRFNLRIGGVKV